MISTDSLNWLRLKGHLNIESARQSDTIMACGSCSFVCTLHYPIIVTMKTYLKALNFRNACQVYVVECVSKIKSILSMVFYSIYRAVRLHFFPIFLWWSWRSVLYLVIVIKSEVWIINYCLRLRHEKMVSAVRLTMFLRHVMTHHNFCASHIHRHGLQLDLLTVDEGLWVLHLIIGKSVDFCFLGFLLLWHLVRLWFLLTTLGSFCLQCWQRDFPLKRIDRHSIFLHPKSIIRY